jgi:hypothetical protein
MEGENEIGDREGDRVIGRAIERVIGRAIGRAHGMPNAQGALKNAIFFFFIPQGLFLSQVHKSVP